MGATPAPAPVAAPGVNLPDSANATAQAQADAMQQETETVALDSKNRYAERSGQKVLTTSLPKGDVAESAAGRWAGQEVSARLSAMHSLRCSTDQAKRKPIEEEGELRERLEAMAEWLQQGAEDVKARERICDEREQGWDAQRTHVMTQVAHMQQGVESLTELALANAALVQVLTQRLGGGCDKGGVTAAAERVARAHAMCNAFNMQVELDTSARVDRAQEKTGQDGGRPTMPMKGVEPGSPDTQVGVAAAAERMTQAGVMCSAVSLQAELDTSAREHAEQMWACEDRERPATPMKDTEGIEPRSPGTEGEGRTRHQGVSRASLPQNDGRAGGGGVNTGNLIDSQLDGGDRQAASRRKLFVALDDRSIDSDSEDSQKSAQERCGVTAAEAAVEASEAGMAELYAEEDGAAVGVMSESLEENGVAPTARKESSRMRRRKAKEREVEEWLRGARARADDAYKEAMVQASQRQAAATRRDAAGLARGQLVARAVTDAEAELRARDEQGWNSALLELARVVAAEAKRRAAAEAHARLSVVARAAGRKAEEQLSQWESTDARLARGRQARAVRLAAGSGAGAQGGLESAANAVLFGARASRAFRRRMVAMAQREADGEEARKRRVLHAKVEANLRAARRKWQKDQASGGLEGWGMEDRSEREHRWYAIRHDATRERDGAGGSRRGARGGAHGLYFRQGS